MKKFLNTLSKSMISILIIAFVSNSTAFAATNQIITKDARTGKYYQYNYADLKNSLLSGNSLFDDFSSKTVVAFVDNKKGNVSYNYVVSQFNKDKQNFKLDSVTEKATVDQIVKISDVSKVSLDAIGKVVVYEPQTSTSTDTQGSINSSDSSDSNHVTPQPVNVGTVRVINLTTIKVIFDGAITDAIAAKANYSLSKGTLTAAEKTGDKEVTLSVSGLTYQDTTTLTVVSSSYSKQFIMPSINELYTLVINTDNGEIVKSDGVSQIMLSASIVDKATGSIVVKEANIAFTATLGSLSQCQAAMQNGKATTQLTSIFSQSSITSMVTATVLSCPSAREYEEFTSQKIIKFIPTVSPISAGSDQGDRFYVKFSGSISAADYKNVVTSPNWNGHPFGIQYKGDLQEYKDIKIVDVYNKTPDTLMFVLDTDDIGSDTPSIAPTIGRGSGQLEIMDSSFEGTGTIGNYLKNGVNHTVAFTDDVTGIVLNSSDITFTMSDALKPSVSTVSAINMTDFTEITVTATEPLAQSLVETTTQGAINAHFTIDGKKIRLLKNPELLTTEKINEAKANNEIIVAWLSVGEYNTNGAPVDSRNIVKIEILKDFILSTGTHHMKVINIGDYAGNMNTEEQDFSVSN